jgi:hypothetical protein
MTTKAAMGRLGALAWAWFVFWTLTASPCYADKVLTYVGKGIDFSAYRTYQWLPPKILAKTGVVEDDPEFAPLIKAAVNRQMTKLGLIEVGEGADLQVSALALSESIPQLEAVIFPGRMALDFATPIAAMGRYNRQGTLVVNLIDTATKKSAWAGLARENLDNKPGAGKKKIDQAAVKIFKKYPLKK